MLHPDLQALQGEWRDWTKSDKTYIVAGDRCKVLNADMTNRLIQGTRDAFHPLIISNGQVHWGVARNFILHIRQNGDAAEWVSKNPKKKGFWWKRTSGPRKHPSESSTVAESSTWDAEEDWDPPDGWATETAEKSWEPGWRDGKDWWKNSEWESNANTEWESNASTRSPNATWKGDNGQGKKGSSWMYTEGKYGVKGGPKGSSGWKGDAGAAEDPFDDSPTSSSRTGSQAARDEWWNEESGYSKPRKSNKIPDGPPSQDPPKPPAQQAASLALSSDGLTAPTGGCGAIWVALRDILVRETIELHSPELTRLPRDALCKQVSPWEQFPVPGDGNDAAGAMVVRMRIIYESPDDSQSDTDGYVSILAYDSNSYFTFLALNLVIGDEPRSEQSSWPLCQTLDGLIIYEVPQGCAGAKWLTLVDMPLRVWTQDRGATTAVEIASNTHFIQLRAWTLDHGIFVMEVRLERSDNSGQGIEGFITFDMQKFEFHVKATLPLMVLCGEPVQERGFMAHSP